MFPLMLFLNDHLDAKRLETYQNNFRAVVYHPYHSKNKWAWRAWVAGQLILQLHQIRAPHHLYTHANRHRDRVLAFPLRKQAQLVFLKQNQNKYLFRRFEMITTNLLLHDYTTM